MPENGKKEIEDLLAFPKLLSEYLKIMFELPFRDRDPFQENTGRLKKRFRFLEGKIDEFEKKYLTEEKQYITSEMLEKKFEETLPPSLRPKYMVHVNFLKELEQWEKENPEWKKECQQWKKKEEKWKKEYEQWKKEYEQWKKENPEAVKIKMLRRLIDEISDLPRTIKTEIRKEVNFEDDF